jgi:hypothetical protein
VRHGEPSQHSCRTGHDQSTTPKHRRNRIGSARVRSTATPSRPDPSEPVGCASAHLPRTAHRTTPSRTINAHHRSSQELVGCALAHLPRTAHRTTPSRTINAHHRCRQAAPKARRPHEGCRYAQAGCRPTACARITPANTRTRPTL